MPLKIIRIRLIRVRLLPQYNFINKNILKIFLFRRFVCFKKFWEVRKDIKPGINWRTFRSSSRNSGFFISSTNVVGLSRPLRACVRQEELDVSLRLSLCALRLIKTRTQVTQEMKLPAKVVEIACLQDFSLFLGDP